MSTSYDFTLKVPVCTTAATLYTMWIDGDSHATMTGAAATSEPKVGGRFTAWDGYIEGTWAELRPEDHLVMRWRTSEFPPDAPDSVVTLDLEDTDDGCVVTLHHRNCPPGQGERYEKGWDEFYFQPIRKYFAPFGE